MWILEYYLTCRGGTCTRRCCYIEKILLTFFKFKVYSQVVDVVDVVVLLVVDVVVA